MDFTILHPNQPSIEMFPTKEYKSNFFNNKRLILGIFGD